MGWPPNAAAYRRSKAHLHISLAPPALMVIERTSICFWFAPHLRYCCLSILTPPSPPVHQNISSKIGYIAEALLVRHASRIQEHIWEHFHRPFGWLHLRTCSMSIAHVDSFIVLFFLKFCHPRRWLWAINWEHDFTRSCFMIKTNIARIANAVQVTLWLST